MKTVEYLAKILPDGHLSLPEELQDRLKPDGNVRVMLFLEEEEASWRSFVMNQFLAGYSEEDSIYDRL